MLEEGIFDIHCHIVPGVDDNATYIGSPAKLVKRLGYVKDGKRLKL